MKNFKLLLLIIFPFISLAQTSKITYLDFDGKELSYNQFYKIQSKGILVGQNDEGSVYRLIKEREKSGKINDYKELISFLNTSLKTNYDSTKPIYICYSPGPDILNTTSRIISEEELDSGQQDHLNFKRKLEKEINGQVLNVFKKPSQFVYEGIKGIAWKKDPNNEIEKRFFSEYHYQYASFVIIFPNGDYNVYLGEFSYNKVFDYVKSWKKKNKSK